MIVNQREALRLINEEGESAYGLLLREDPKFEQRFIRLCKSMKNLLTDVRKKFPDAEYYTASGGFNLLIGSSHGANADAQQELEALTGINVEVGDGDY